MSFVCDLLLLISAGSLGLFAGAMVTEGIVLVPYWRSLPPAAFFAWYAANDRRLLRFFGQLTSATALLVVVAAVVALWTGHPAAAHAALSAALMIAVVASFFLYFKRANQSFATASIDPAAVATELARWAAWHWLRTLLSFLAVASALDAL